MSARDVVRAFGPYALVAAVGAAILLPYLGAFALWEPLEPLYAQSAREMAERGSWTVPYFNDSVRMTKPILAYWSVLVGFGIFGATEMGARIGGALFAIGGLLAVCYAASRLFGRRCGLLSALVLATFPQFHFLARRATPDVFLATSFGAGLLFVALGLYGEQGRRDVHLLVGYAWIALAVLAKGPVIAAAVLVATGATLGLARVDFPRLRLRERDPESSDAPADGLRQLVRFAIVLAVVAGPWYAIALLRQPSLMIDDLLVFNHVHRFFNEVENSGSTTYYLRTIAFGFFPWTGFVPVALALLGSSRDRETRGTERAETLLIVAAAMIFVVFTLSVTKFPHYFAIAQVPFAVLVGRALDRLLADTESPTGRIAFVVASMLFLLPCADFSRSRGMRYLMESFTDARSVPDTFEPGPFFGIFVPVTLVVLLAGVIVRSRWTVGAFVACAVAFGCYCSWDLIPRLSPYKSARQLAMGWLDRAGPEDRLGVYDTSLAGLVFYTDRRLHPLVEQVDLIEFMSPAGETRYAVAPKDDLRRLSTVFGRRYPGNKLYLADGRHPDDALITNRRPVIGIDDVTEIPPRR